MRSNGNGAAPSRDPVMENLMIRDLITRGGMGQPPAVNMWQGLNPLQPSNAGPGSVLTIQLRNVGLVKRLVVKLTATITAHATATMTLTPYGLANFLSNVIFTDLANNQRINTSGWHLFALSSVRRNRVYGASYVNDSPCGYGVRVDGVGAPPSYDFAGENNFVIYAPTEIPDGVGTYDISMFYEVPFSYSDFDLRGAVFANTVQATMQLQCTINPNFFVAAGDDPTLAVYQSDGAGLATIGDIRWQVYQNYLDQLPRDPRSGVLYLPRLDLGSAYLLNQTSSGTLVQNQDNAVPFVNSRQYYSAIMIYDNNGTLNRGTDLDDISVVSANFTNIVKLDPFTWFLFGRNEIQTDFPAAGYYLSFRDRPIDTNQYGNMQMIIRPSNVGGQGSVAFLGWESIGVIGLIEQSGALPSGAGW